MRLALALCTTCACGRIGFDGAIDGATYHEPGGELDPSFGTGGSTTLGTGQARLELYDVIPRDPGGYLCIGPHELSSGAHFGLFGFGSDGQLDPAFGTGGIADVGPTSLDYGYGLLRLPDGRIVVTGDGDDKTGTNDNITIGMIDPAGAVDPAFGVGGFQRFDGGELVGDTAKRSVRLASSVVTCGAWSYNTPDSHFALVALGLDGAPVAAFGAGGRVTADFHPGVGDTCADLTVGPSGNLVAVGSTNARGFVVAYRADGTRDPSFAGGSTVELGTAFAALSGITIAPDGDIVTVGESANMGLVARLASDGTPRAGFGQASTVMLPGVAVLTDVVVQPNGKIIAVGESATLAGVVVRLLADGTLDPTFATGGVLQLRAGSETVFERVILAADGAIIAVGYVGSVPLTRGVIARLR